MGIRITSLNSWENQLRRVYLSREDLVYPPGQQPQGQSSHVFPSLHLLLSSLPVDISPDSSERAHWARNKGKRGKTA